MKRGKVWPLLFLLASCASGPPRAVLQLEARGGFVVSSSPMVAHPQTPRVRAGRLEFTYSFLAENRGDQLVTLELSHASVSVARHDASVACNVAGHAFGEYLLEPAARTRVDCDIGFPRQEGSLAQNGDAMAELTVPVSSQGYVTSVSFLYLLSKGDAR